MLNDRSWLSPMVEEHAELNMIQGVLSYGLVATITVTHVSIVSL
jgi:hypothetical protein